MNTFQLRPDGYLTGSTTVLNHWTEYCNELYTFQLRTDASLSSNQTRISKHTTLPVLWQEAEKVECSLKAANSTAIDIA